MGSFTCITQHTYSFTSHLKDEAIMVKCLAQGTSAATSQARDSNPHSDNTRTWVQCTRPLGHDTPYHNVKYYMEEKEYIHVKDIPITLTYRLIDCFCTHRTKHLRYFTKEQWHSQEFQSGSKPCLRVIYRHKTPTSLWIYRQTLFCQQVGGFPPAPFGYATAKEHLDKISQNNAYYVYYILFYLWHPYSWINL